MEEQKIEVRSEKKKKKRKRLDVKMEIVREHPDKTAPLVGYFPSGFDPQKVSTSKEDEPRVRVFRNKQRPNRLQLVVSPEGSKVDFVGTSYSGEATASQVCTYALGVLDKETQSLKIVPIACNKIFRLEPRVGESDSCEEELTKELKEEDLTAERKADKIRDLTNVYGTKRAISRAKKMASLNEKEGSSTQKELEKKIEGVTINMEALESAGAYSARNIPPHDSTATTPEKAFPLDRIILKGEWNHLLDVLELMQAGAEIAHDSYPSFVCNRMHKLQAMQDEDEKKRLACVFSYITHLIKFKNQRSVDSPASAKYHKIPGILFQKFLTMFADSERFEPPIEKQNLLISYVLVLTLYADGFRTDLTDIARDLKMTTMPLREHYKNLGCKLSREDKLLLVTLPVPLKFPKPKMERRRR